MLVWIVLALGPAQGGDTALTPLIEKLERAQTVRVDFEIGVRGRTVMKGRLLLKGPDKLCLRGEFQSAPLEYYLDGRRCILRSWTSAVPTETAPPVHPGPRARFAVAPLGRALDERVAPGKVENVVDLGLKTLGGRERRLIEYTLAGDPTKIVLHLDPATGLPMRRELGIGANQVVEVYSAFVLDEPIADDAVAYVSPGRLALAQAAQLARAAELYERFTGRPAASLEALVKKPADLDPTAVWPDGGFVLGGRLPKDPWGRPFALSRTGDGASIVSRGADGRPGGEGQDADAVAAIGPSGGRVVAPTERLRAHYAGRALVQVVAAAVRAYSDAYAVGPVDLARPPEGITLAPEGGWVPGGVLPSDPWGERLELRPTEAGTAVLVKGALERALRPSDLTPQERTALEAAGGKADGDARPAWLEELKQRTAVLPVDPFAATARVYYNERGVIAALKRISRAQAEFRARDRDGNGAQDYWTGDVAGLYALTDPAGEPLRLIEVAAARADAARLRTDGLQGRMKGLDDPLPVPMLGYYLQAIRLNGSVSPKAPYGQNTGGRPDLGPHFNPRAFGVCAFPADYGSTGTKTYIISEDDRVFWSDTGGDPVDEYPSFDVIQARWSLLNQ